MRKKAVALLSGGLDSMLAVKVVLSEGIEVTGINFSTPFFTEKQAVKAARQLGIPLEVLDITSEHLEVVKSPKHGYGKHINPCIDCHALMIKKAGEYMEGIGGSFIITGEVLGERRKSQTKAALKIVEKESGYEGRILRPLSAKLLEETIPEKEGWINRERLLDIFGRCRQPQMELAKRFGIEDYPTPAGGCKLTEPVFSHRLKDLFSQEKDFTIKDIELLKIGRHFRSSSGIKIIVGRNKEENEKLLELGGEKDTYLQTADFMGPTTLVPVNEPRTISEAAAITTRYSDIEDKDSVEVEWWKLGNQERGVVRVSPMNSERIDAFRV
ncbi:MAG: tRNA 4-thiouridine(8) synthase ThiI [bacterium]|nr:tRNA 4-thiouridine(8) synthase ThiI [bacterium]